MPIVLLLAKNIGRKTFIAVEYLKTSMNQQSIVKVGVLQASHQNIQMTNPAKINLHTKILSVQSLLRVFFLYILSRI